MPSTYHRAHRYSASHARPRSAVLTRALLVLGVLLVAVTLGFGGYAVGTAVTSPPMGHAKVIAPSAPSPPAATAPVAPHTAPAPGPTAGQLHTLHLWHVLHMEHLAHLAWLRAHGIPVQRQ